MTPADEQRALQRDLLLARAAAERVALATQVGKLRERGRTPRGIASLLFRGARSAQRSHLVGFATMATRLARAQPWLVPAVIGGTAKLARSRTLRWLVVAGAAGAAAWWFLQREDDPGDAGAAAGLPAAIDLADDD
jgi:hypothetical protein